MFSSRYIESTIVLSCSSTEFAHARIMQRRRQASVHIGFALVHSGYLDVQPRCVAMWHVSTRTRRRWSSRRASRPPSKAIASTVRTAACTRRWPTRRRARVCRTTPQRELRGPIAGTAWRKRERRERNPEGRQGGQGRRPREARRHGMRSTTRETRAIPKPQTLSEMPRDCSSPITCLHSASTNVVHNKKR
jgi:hypothetical protein